MDKNKTLLMTLLNKNNNYLNDDSNFQLNIIYTKVLFLIIFLVVIVGLVYRIISLVNNFSDLSFIELSSLVIGNACFYGCFLAIKNSAILNIVVNPLFIGGIILPSFFNGWLFNYLIMVYFNNNINITFVFIILSIIVYYIILNSYYVKINKVNKDE
ncbi:MAG: hypothetical protein LBR40_00425 [Bacilli bacterium]|jgi:hypothetical protein|nr:hypothetical protein [Bacilli bacterium]